MAYFPPPDALNYVNTHQRGHPPATKPPRTHPPDPAYRLGPSAEPAKGGPEQSGPLPFCPCRHETDEAIRRRSDSALSSPNRLDSVAESVDLVAISNVWRMTESSSSDTERVDPDEVGVVIDAVLHASRALVAVAARSLAVVADEVTLPQYRTLVLLAGRSPQGMAALAAALGVSPSTVTRMCDRLIRKGLIRRRTSTRDRRQVRVALTTEGKRVVAEVTARRRAEIGRIISAIPVARRTELAQALSAFAESAGELPDRDWTSGWEL